MKSFIYLAAERQQRQNQVHRKMSKLLSTQPEYWCFWLSIIHNDWQWLCQPYQEMPKIELETFQIQSTGSVTELDLFPPQVSLGSMCHN